MLAPIKLVLVLLAVSNIACDGATPSSRVIYSNHLTSLDAILTRADVTLDTAEGRDGRGVIRVDTTGATTIRLAEIRPGDAEGMVLTYRGHLRAANLKGRAYLEMRCTIPGHEELIARALDTAVMGTSGPVSQQTRCFLEEGQHAEIVKLNVVVEGAGTIWIGPILLGQATREMIETAGR